eukprot:scaffold49982_cov36-Tisochrysis_lutea.AAC.3
MSPYPELGQHPGARGTVAQTSVSPVRRRRVAVDTHTAAKTMVTRVACDDELRPRLERRALADLPSLTRASATTATIVAAVAATTPVGVKSSRGISISGRGQCPSPPARLCFSRDERLVCDTDASAAARTAAPAASSASATIATPSSLDVT